MDLEKRMATQPPPPPVWTEEQLRRAIALDNALMFLGRGPGFIETPAERRLRWAVRRGLRLAEALRCDIPWAAFVTACRQCLGEPGDWTGEEIAGAHLLILTWVPKFGSAEKALSEVRNPPPATPQTQEPPKTGNTNECK